MKKKTKQEKLQHKLENLGFWRLLWSFPIKGMIILSAIATIIAFPFNLTAGFVALGITIGSLTINGLNYLLFDKVDELFHKKIYNATIELNRLKEQEIITYEEYKSNNPNVSSIAINYPNGEKRVSSIHCDKGPIVVDEDDKAFDAAIEIVNSEKPKQEKVCIAENSSYLRENFNEISKETNKTL